MNPNLKSKRWLLSVIILAAILFVAWIWKWNTLMSNPLLLSYNVFSYAWGGHKFSICKNGDVYLAKNYDSEQYTLVGNLGERGGHRLQQHLGPTSFTVSECHDDPAAFDDDWCSYVDYYNRGLPKKLKKEMADTIDFQPVFDAFETLKTVVKIKSYESGHYIPWKYAEMFPLSEHLGITETKELPEVIRDEAEAYLNTPGAGGRYYHVHEGEKYFKIALERSWEKKEGQTSSYMPLGYISVAREPYYNMISSQETLSKLAQWDIDQNLLIQNTDVEFIVPPQHSQAIKNYFNEAIRAILIPMDEKKISVIDISVWTEFPLIQQVSESEVCKAR